MAAVDGGTVTMQGQATIAGDITGTFLMVSALSGTADTIVTPGVFKLINADLVAEATIVAPAQFLLYADLVGQGSINAQSEMVLAAASGLSGQATASQDADVFYDAAATASGEASTVPSATVVYTVGSAVTAEATVTAAALEDDEMAADAIGTSSISSAMGVNYGVSATVTASSDILGVGLLRPAVLPTFRAVPTQDSLRLIGLQSGREYHARKEQLSAGGPPLPRTNDEVLASTQKLGRVQTPQTDAASLEQQRRIRQRFNPNAES